MSYYTDAQDLDTTVGKTVESVEHSSDVFKMTFTDGSILAMWHEPDCCETVWLEDITGETEDTIGKVVRLAEVRHEGEEVEWGLSSTWTFIEIRTDGGDLTLRWCGTSNGYYSETPAIAVFCDEDAMHRHI